jgi:intracellular septation protein
MTERPISPFVKQALELGPTLFFFGLYFLIKDETYSLGGRAYSGFIVAALILVPVLLGAMAALWYLTGRLSRMQVFTAVMVIFFGALTAWFNDERFFKMKTTIVYGFFAGLLAVGLVQRRSYLQWVMGEMLPMRDEGWMILTRRLTAMFAALAIANEAIWRTQSTELWVTLETFVLPAALFVFLWVQFVILHKYMIEPDAGKADGRK